MRAETTRRILSDVSAKCFTTSLFPARLSEHLDSVPRTTVCLPPATLPMFAEELKSIRRLGWRHVLLPLTRL